MDTSFYRAPRRTPAEVRAQHSIAFSFEEELAVSVLRGSWEQQTGTRLTFADVVRACIWRMFRANYPEDTVLQGAPPPEPPIRTVRLAECRSCGESFPAEDLSKDLNCAACWRAFYNLTDVPGQEASKGKGVKRGK